MLVRSLRVVERCRVCHSRLLSSSSSSRAPPSRPTSLPPAVLDLAHVVGAPQAAKQNIVDRAYPLDPAVVDEVVRLEAEAVALRREIQRARERRNTVSAAVSLADRLALKEEGKEIKALLKALEPRLSTLSKTLDDLALQLPNSSHPDSPVGDEAAARTVRTLGPTIPSPPPPADPTRDHLPLSSPQSLAWTDFPSAALVSGPSWPILTNEAVLLELALTNYAFSITLKHGFQPVLTPDVVRSDVADRCGFRPRDGEAQQTYFLSDGTLGGDTSLCLAGTAEVPLVAMAAATTFLAEELPLKRVALGRAFRAEAGARGADSRGLYRVHQFSKVEMVVICAEDDSERILEELRSVQEEILGSLGLSLRVLDMPTQELGASAHRKYDIEAWMPGRGKWGELSSASNCTSYQSRRLSIRYRPSPSSPLPPPSEFIATPTTPTAFAATPLYPPPSSPPAPKLAYAHTLNATAAAIPRLIVALLENGVVLGAKGEGVEKVRLPRVLQRFWIGGGEGIKWVPEGEALRQE